MMYDTRTSFISAEKQPIGTRGGM